MSTKSPFASAFGKKTTEGGGATEGREGTSYAKN